MKPLLFLPLLALVAVPAQAQDKQSEIAEAGVAENWGGAELVPHEPLDAEVRGLDRERAAGNTHGSEEPPGTDPLAAGSERNEAAATRALSDNEAPQLEVEGSNHSGTRASAQASSSETRTDVEAGE